MFAYNLEENLLQLSADLTSGTYKHGAYRPVVLYEKKRRDLAVATVRDRVVHRLVYDHLVRIFDKGFDPDVWSCRKGKGLHACLDRTQQVLQKYPHCFVWRADITKFYDNVNQAVLRSSLLRKIGHDLTIIRVIDEVISSYSMVKQASKQGIPIGNLTSQIFGNIYLNEFDRFVRHTLKPQAYIRYGDDFILLFDNRSQTYEARIIGTDFLADNLGLTVNPRNDVVVSGNSGLKFLGHAISKNFGVVDKHTTHSALAKINRSNIASYRSLKLVKTVKDQLDWFLLEENFDI